MLTDFVCRENTQPGPGVKTNQSKFQMQCRKNWDAPGPDADADEKAADEDKMLKQVFATKNGMQAEQQQQELEQGSFLFLRAPALTPSNNFSTFSAPSARFRNTICKICKGQAGKGGKKLKPLPHLESTSSPVEFSHIKSKYNPNICHIAQHKSIAMSLSRNSFRIATGGLRILL